jgi:4-aminobutyrate aminotransferase
MLATRIALSTSSSASCKTRLSAGIGRLSQHTFVSGKGTYLTTDEGQTLLDFASGIGVTNTGHSHPKVVAAAQAQVAKLVHGQVNIGFHKPMLDLIQKMDDHEVTKIMNDPASPTNFFFWNSGSEAVEAAVKLARHATKKQGLVVFNGGYHGRTIGTMSMTTSKNIFRAGFGPNMPGVFVSPFPYVHKFKKFYAGDPATAEERCVEHAKAQLEMLLKMQAPASDIAAVVIEPVQGEGGYVPAPPAFIKFLREFCTEHNILLVFDEVQTGFGRTGSWFAADHYGVRPDILVFAKGIASGFPISGIAASKALMDTQPPGSMGGTYSGNAVACAAGAATIDAMVEENMFSNCHERGAQLVAGLERLKNMGYPIADIRGLGLMIGCEFAEDAGAIGMDVSQACLRKGLLMLQTSVYDTVRFIPPLNVSEQEVDDALKIFREALDEVVTSRKASGKNVA